MINQSWERLIHPKISSGYYINIFGEVYNENSPNDIITPSYHSSNGYDFILLINNNMKTQLFPIDDLVALTFIPIPDNLIGKKVKVNHIDGDTRNSYVSNLEWVEDIEEWREIDCVDILPGRYFVSSWGRIKNKERLLKPFVNRYGYLGVCLVTTGRKQQHVSVHRITAMKFVNSHSDQNDIVNHIDGSTDNNYWKNLEWTSEKGNTQHAMLIDHMINGESHPWAKLSITDVRQICELLVKYDGSVVRVYNELKRDIPVINRWIISVIKCKKCWNSVSDLYFKYEDFDHISKTYLSEKDIRLICEILTKTNGSLKETLEILKSKNITYVTLNHVSKIKHKRVWSDISDEYFTINSGKFVVK